MLYVECKPDITLVKFITDLPRREIIHDFRGKGWICNRLRILRNTDGMLDEDPWAIQPPYINSLKLRHDFPEHGIRVFHDVYQHNHVIMLRPRLEEWILKAAWDAHIEPRYYELPDHGVQLHKEINLRLNHFEDLLADLRHTQRLKLLKRLLERGR